VIFGPLGRLIIDDMAEDKLLLMLNWFYVMIFSCEKIGLGDRIDNIDQIGHFESGLKRGA
jgi:hypothetical protein